MHENALLRALESTCQSLYCGTDSGRFIDLGRPLGESTPRKAETEWCHHSDKDTRNTEKECAKHDRTTFVHWPPLLNSMCGRCLYLFVARLDFLNTAAYRLKDMASVNKN